MSYNGQGNGYARSITLTAASAGANVDMDGSLGCGVRVYINITAITGTTPTLTVTIRGKDRTSGQYHNILASAALNATGMTVLTVYPGLVAAANSVANDLIPPEFNISYAIGGTTPAVTATISATVIQ